MQHPTILDTEYATVLRKVGKCTKIYREFPIKCKLEWIAAFYIVHTVQAVDCSHNFTTYDILQAKRNVGMQCKAI